MTDVTARLLAEKMKAILGQPIMVANKPGGTGIVGVNFALGQKEDGYTVIVAPMNESLTSAYFQGSEPIDLKNFSFIGGYMPQQRVLFTTPEKPYRTFAEFIAYVKQRPRETSAGSGGGQFALEVIKSIAVKDRLKMKYVMFKSGGEASTAILGKHVDICETGVGNFWAIITRPICFSMYVVGRSSFIAPWIFKRLKLRYRSGSFSSTECKWGYHANRS